MDLIKDVQCITIREEADNRNKEFLAQKQGKMDQFKEEYIACDISFIRCDLSPRLGKVVKSDAVLQRQKNYVASFYEKNYPRL